MALFLFQNEKVLDVANNLIFKCSMALLLGIFIINSLHAQEYQIHENPGQPAPVTINFEAIENDFYPNLVEIAPESGGEAYQEKLSAIKAARGEKTFPKKVEQFRSKKAQSPKALKGFRGNRSNGVPNDNDIAISQEGKIVSVTNSRISIFDTSGQRLDFHSLEAFSDTLGIQGNKYDPRVAYDPEAKRFVIAFLNGNLDTTSRIIFAFSQSQDPLGNWHLYSVPGDALDNGSWSDFPAMALTQDELFLTINLIYNDSSWQKGFRQSVVWQIDKQKAYQGDTLDTRLYSGIEYQGKPIRNLTPARGGGNDLQGPEIYLLSNRNFDERNDTFFLVEITGRQDDPQTQLDLEVVAADQDYGVPPNADQPRDLKFATNDARVLSTFITDDRIHLAGNSVNFNNNRATIYHGQITDLNKSDPSANLNILENPLLEYGYPSLAFAGKSKTDNEVMIMANHTADTIRPGNSAIYFDNGNYSEPRMIKEGEGFVNVQRGDLQRWGDYSGIQRLPDGTQNFWVSGYFGFRGNLGTRSNGTWISKLGVDGSSGTKGNPSKDLEANAFPNPVQTGFNVEFELSKHRYLNFTLWDNQGRKLKSLRQQLVKPGEHRFYFSMRSLPDGVYWLRIQGDEEQIAHKKLIKQ